MNRVSRAWRRESEREVYPARQLANYAPSPTSTGSSISHTEPSTSTSSNMYAENKYTNTNLNVCQGANLDAGLNSNSNSNTNLKSNFTVKGSTNVPVYTQQEIAKISERMPLVAFTNVLLKMVESPRTIVSMQDIHDGTCILFACRTLFPSIFGTSSVREKWEWLNKSRIKGIIVGSANATTNTNATPELMNVLTTIRLLIDGCVSLYKYTIKTKTNSGGSCGKPNSPLADLYIEDLVLQMNQIVEHVLQSRKTTTVLSPKHQQALFLRYSSTVITLLEMICDILLLCFMHMQQFQNFFISSVGSIRSDLQHCMLQYMEHAVSIASSESIPTHQPNSKHFDRDQAASPKSHLQPSRSLRNNREQASSPRLQQQSKSHGFRRSDRIASTDLSPAPLSPLQNPQPRTRLSDKPVHGDSPPSVQVTQMHTHTKSQMHTQTQTKAKMQTQAQVSMSNNLVNPKQSSAQIPLPTQDHSPTYHTLRHKYERLKEKYIAMQHRYDATVKDKNNAQTVAETAQREVDELRLCCETLKSQIHSTDLHNPADLERIQELELQISTATNAADCSSVSNPESHHPADVTKIQELQARNDELILQNRARIAALQEKHQQDVAALQEKHQQDIAALQEKHQQGITALQNKPTTS